MNAAYKEIQKKRAEYRKKKQKPIIKIGETKTKIYPNK